jgi:hypothetical protein
MNSATRPSSHQMVHWTFQFAADVLTCRVEAEGSLYRLSVVPNGNDQPAIVETFASGAAALQRHAALASRLRERGWRVIAYTGRAASRRQLRAA